jgi:hypothetical protein
MRLGKLKSARKLSDATIAKRYLDLQRLRDEVRKAEATIHNLRFPNSETNRSKPLPAIARGKTGHRSTS